MIAISEMAETGKWVAEFGFTVMCGAALFLGTIVILAMCICAGIAVYVVMRQWMRDQAKENNNDNDE